MITTKPYQDPQTFDSFGMLDLAVQLTKVADAIADLADDDPRIVAGSADLKYATQFHRFEKRHPDRFFQFGIAERTMVGAAAGMAASGLRPYIATFASFSGLLCYEGIRTDLAYPQVPVRLIGTHSGISMGFFSTSHHATEDLSALRSVAGLIVLSPADGASAAALLRAYVDEPGPVYLRMGRGRETSVDDDAVGLTPGIPRTLRRGSDLLLISTGVVVRAALDAAEQLSAGGIETTVLDVHTIKPFDADTIAEEAARHPAVLTVEDHNVEGGLGTLVQEALGAARVDVATYKHGILDEYAVIGPPSHLYRYYGLDADGVATVARRLLDRDNVRPVRGPLWQDQDAAGVIASVRPRD